MRQSRAGWFRDLVAWSGGVRMWWLVVRCLLFVGSAVGCIGHGRASDHVWCVFVQLELVLEVMLEVVLGSDK